MRIRYIKILRSVQASCVAVDLAISYFSLIFPPINFALTNFGSARYITARPIEISLETTVQ